MSVEKQIQIAIAWADLFICTALHWLAYIIPLTILFVLVFLIVWRHRPDPYLIDYDAPGVDITSEGPEDSESWHEMGGESNAAVR